MENTGRRIVTVNELLEAANERLLGVQVGMALTLAVQELRAELLAGMTLVVDVPEHDHPHVLTDLLIGEGTTPFEVRLLPMYDDCPDD